MRAVVQRVTSASVAVDGKIISNISRGLMVLVGIGANDTVSDATTLSNKLLSLKAFSHLTEEDKKWKSNVKDVDGEILCVSQFTLMADTKRASPNFARAMSGTASKELYETFLQNLRTSYKAEKIQDGEFGAMMNVTLTNDGPVTFTLDTRKIEQADGEAQ